MHARAVAAKVLVDVVVGGCSLDDAFDDVIAQLQSPREAPLVKELCYGTLRWRWRLTALLRVLMDRPVRPADADIEQLLLAGLYQVLYMDVPAPLAVDSTVAATTELGKPWARGLVNAVLRRFLREQEDVLPHADATEVASFSHPAWLIEEIRRDWPGQADAILRANNTRAPMTLRVNRNKTTREAYQALLAQAGHHATPGRVSPDALVLAAPVTVDALPEFNAGWVSVQDEAAQLAAPWLDAKPGMRVLDACAAPGGKLGHIAECCPDLGELVALDVSTHRLDLVESTIARLNVRARLICHNATQPEVWWDGALFDRILLDAPCSGVGVIRRHPDIKSLRRDTDIPALAARQHALLTALWPLLAPGGMLLYVTCSILDIENAGQMSAFLRMHPDALEQPLPATCGHTLAVGRQILPGDDNMDGFYYAAISKRT